MGFEPTVELPLHGISSAAPSATRPPLPTSPTFAFVHQRPRSRLPPRAYGRIWRRGEDLNPRGTCAPIRFRVGRLQPGSATPPHDVVSILYLRAAINLPIRLWQIHVLSKFRWVRRWLDETFDRSSQVLESEVSIALNHCQALPPSKLLNRAQVYPSHDEPGGKSMAVTMPCVPPEVTRVLPLGL